MSARQAAASISVRSNVWRLGVTVNQRSLTPYTEKIRQHQTHKQRTTIMSTEDKGRGNVISLAERASSRRRKVRPALPIGVRPLSNRYSARMCTVETDQVKFLLALRHYSRAPSPRKWRLAKRRLTALGMAVSRCCDLVDMLGGDVPAGTEPVFKTEQDQYEHTRLADFIATKALPFIEFWENALAAVDAGGALPIEPKDVPLWAKQ